MKIAQGSIYNFLNTIATKPSTPAGGSTAALGAATAAALIEMVARYTIDREEVEKKTIAYMEGLVDEASFLRHEFLNYMDKDVGAYKDLMAAQKNKEEDMEGYHKKSIQIPLQMAERLVYMIGLIEDIFETGSQILLTDTTAALLIAKVTFISLIYHIRFNLTYIKDKEFFDHISSKLKSLEGKVDWLTAT